MYIESVKYLFQVNNCLGFLNLMDKHVLAEIALITKLSHNEKIKIQSFEGINISYYIFVIATF